MKTTDEQKIKWLKEGKCHVCGSNQPHSHPNHVWLANPVPRTTDPKLKERIDFEDKSNEIVLGKIIGKKVEL